LKRAPQRDFIFLISFPSNVAEPKWYKVCLKINFAPNFGANITSLRFWNGKGGEVWHSPKGIISITLEMIWIYMRMRVYIELNTQRYRNEHGDTVNPNSIKSMKKNTL